MSNIHLHPRVVFYLDGANWIAHCLEFDLAGEGASREEAFEDLKKAIQIQVEADSLRSSPMDLFKPADSEYFAMYEAGYDVAVEGLHLASHRLIIDDTHAREYRLSM